MKIDVDKLPQHIAIIMDGNGRWAQKHSIDRILGHRKGVETVRIIVRTCREIGIKYLTLFAFSTENWERPKREVKALMRLLNLYLDKELNELKKQGIRLKIIGNLSRLDSALKTKLMHAMESSAGNDQMVLNIALSYGGQDEIIHAVQKIAQDVGKGLVRIDEINKELFARYLETAGIPDPDLLIRTSGEYRISNFLLWQTAYTELYFTKVLWPEFTKDELLKAIASYQKRERRFGLISEQL
jgi:undecaprenyl diphosphate synthase